MRIPKPKAQADLTLDDVRALVKDVREQGLKIQSHYKKLEEEYSDWEDRVNELDKIITQAEIDTGLTKEEIYKTPSEIDELEGIDLDDFNIGDTSEDNETQSILDG